MRLPLWARVLFRVRACARRPRATRHPPRERPPPSPRRPAALLTLWRMPLSNLRGMVMMCKHVIPSMKERQSGAIVNISSNAVTSTCKHRS